MAKEQVTVFQDFGDDVEMKRLQVVYLDDIGFSVDDIIKWTNYAKATVKSYIKKFAHLLEEAKEIFGKVTKKAKSVILGRRQLVYLFKFYNAENELICSKVGTTTRLPEVRMREEMKYYAEHGIPVDHFEICSVIDCGKYPAEGAESEARAKFIRKYPEAFCKNDRFFGVDISPLTFNKIVNNWLSGKAIA